MAHYSKLMQPKDALLVINYTDLIERNEPETRRVAEFLGVQLQCVPPDETTRGKWNTGLTLQQQKIRDVLEYCGITSVNDSGKLTE